MDAGAAAEIQAKEAAATGLQIGVPLTHLVIVESDVVAGVAADEQVGLDQAPALRRPARCGSPANSAHSFAETVPCHPAPEPEPAVDQWTAPV
jgi:hypothetical protein